MDDTKKPVLRIIDGKKNKIILDPVSDFYFRALEKSVLQAAQDYHDGKIDHETIYGTLEVIDNVMYSTTDDIAISKLQELYDHAVGIAELE